MGVAFVVGRDGSFGWQVLRVALVAAAMLAALRACASALLRVAAGLVLVPVGVGFGGPHMAKTGLTAESTAGLLVLVGGGVLLVGGSAALLRRTRRRWTRIPGVLGLLLALLVGLLTLGQAVAATNVPRTEVGSATPADRGVSYRDVVFPSRDGVALSGWYVPSRNRAAVVLLHGAGSTRSGVLDHAVVLSKLGYGVLLYDARGHGRSDGRAMDFGWRGDADIHGAVSFLMRQPDVDPERIAAVGMSMGGEQAIGAAGADPRIKAVVAEGATNRVAADKAWLSDAFGWRGAVQERIEWLAYGITDVLTSARPPTPLREAVALAAPRPFLIIAAGSVDTEERAASFFQGASPATVAVWVAPDTSHTDALNTRPDEWVARVGAFLGDALTPR